MSYALNSLIEILDQILHPQKHHKNWVLDDDEEEIQTLLEKACFVRDFLAKPPPTISPTELDTLEEEIISKAEEAENVLEFYITELILSSTDHQFNFTISPPDDLGEPFEDVEYQINEFVAAANRKTPDVSQISESDDADNKPSAVSSMRNHEGKFIVGLEQDLSDLENRLRISSKTEIIPIVGMLGTGKTTLAEVIYHKYSSTPSHFDVCLWATVPRASKAESKEAKWKKILHSLLACVAKEDVDKIPEQQYSELRTALHKKLSGARCLTVLDGIQDIKDWDEVRLAFMNAIRQGSRVLLTTRKHDVATYVTSQIHQMRPLSDEECWELLREKVFDEELCPRELEKIGRRIASNCKGLPLEVQEVGDDLKKVNKQKDSWEEFAVSLKSRNLVVGVDKDLMVLKDRLLGRNPGVEIIPIVGMGGTGKTVLARILFDELSSSGSHFEVCAWATISQSYDPRRVLESLLDFVTEKPMHVQDIDELINTLRQYLASRRYLILLDDIWSSEPLEDLRVAFPDDNNGSRIILTTRVKEVANYVHSHSHEMQLLDENDSWELLRRKVFDNESCPVGLEVVGKQISNKCRGLPLAVQVVGGLLSQAERSKSSWEHVAEDVSSFIENEDDQFSGIFSWSYFHLPHYLKPCFLYMASFPEDYEIQASKLIKLWVADGFLSPLLDRSLEEVAEKYLTDLVGRTLILVRERNERFKVKSYGIHDLLRDMCLKKACRKNFLYVKDLRSSKLEENSVDGRRVNIHSSSDCIEDINVSWKLTQHVRSFQAIGPATERILSCVCFESSLLRELDLFEIEFGEFPNDILKLVNLRYLALRCGNSPPESISVLRNLQTLIFQILGVGHFPLGIFDVPRIRHVELKGSEVEMNPVDFSRSFAVQGNLQTLSTIPLEFVTRLSLTRKTPNLRKLGIDCSGSHEIMVDLSDFIELEIFKCSASLSSSQAQPSSSNYIFPSNLRKVVLRGCRMPWEHMSIIGSLPNLEVLKLKEDAFVGDTWIDGEFIRLKFLLLENLNLVCWIPSEGGFCQLKYLRMEGLDLEEWIAESTHFPSLEELKIIDCRQLKEVPGEIGEIDTLKKLTVKLTRDNNKSLEESVEKIQAEQELNGNDSLQVILDKSTTLLYAQGDPGGISIYSDTGNHRSG